MIKSQFPCPVCDVLLSLEDFSEGAAIACTNLKCPSFAASLATEGKNEADAHYKLQKAVEHEITQSGHGPLCQCESCCAKSLSEWERMNNDY